MYGLRAGAAIALLVVAIGVAATPGTGQGVPTIYLYVNDLSDPPILLGFEREELDSLCFEVDYRTTAEIAVLVVNTTQPLGIDTYAVETFEANGIGKDGKDNGILIIVSLDEAAWRIEVGYGLEGILNDAKVGGIGRATLGPALAGGDLYPGLYDATLAIGREIVANYDGAGGGRTPDLIVVDWWQVALAVAVLIGVGVLTKGRLFLWIGNIYRRGGFGGGRSGGGGARGKV